MLCICVPQGFVPILPYTYGIHGTKGPHRDVGFSGVIQDNVGHGTPCRPFKKQKRYAVVALVLWP